MMSIAARVAAGTEWTNSSTDRYAKGMMDEPRRQQNWESNEICWHVKTDLK